MNGELFKAILSMDAYNRGNNKGININLLESAGQFIGNSQIFQESDIDEDTSGVNKGFYAIAHEYEGETVISCRGTDALPQP